MDGCAENQYWKHKQVDVDDEITVFVAYCSLSELYDMSDMRVHRKIGNCQMAKPVIRQIRMIIATTQQLV